MQFLRKDTGGVRRARCRTLESLRVHRDQIQQHEDLAADQLGPPVGWRRTGWRLAQPAVTATCIGPRTQEQLDAALRALDVELDEPTLIRLDEFFPGVGPHPRIARGDPPDPSRRLYGRGRAEGAVHWGHRRDQRRCRRARRRRGSPADHPQLGQHRSARSSPGSRAAARDVRDTASVRTALGDGSFDVVADFLAFTPEQVAADIALSSGRTRQYVFISSASAYQKPPAGCRSWSPPRCGTRSGSTRETRSPARTYS